MNHMNGNDKSELNDSRYQSQLPDIYLNPRLVLDAFAEICEEIMKYVLVTGGVISGIGKGVVSSSIGVLLQHSGVPVTAIKIDPYINIGDVLICICIKNIDSFLHKQTRAPFLRTSMERCMFLTMEGR